MMQFAFGEPSFDRPLDTSPADRLRAHAADVLADLAGVTEAELDTLPVELPVEAAVACGNCRLYGGVAPQIVFPAWLAAAAAHRLVSLLDQAAADATHLNDLWDDATSDEAEDLVAGLLHARMDAWAALLQLDDVLACCSDDADRSLLEAALGDFDAALDRFDRALFTRQDYLLTLSGTHLLDNFRGMLAPEFLDPLPWWLDGRVEALAAEVDAETDQLIDTTFGGAASAGPIVPATPTRGRLRAATSQIYAAAASAPAPAAADAVLRWRSPDRGSVAALVAPVVRQPIPERLVFDFTTANGVPAAALVGRTCSLAGVETVIERRTVDGIERAVATFSGAAVLGSRLEDDQPIALFVLPDPVAWTFLAAP